MICAPPDGSRTKHQQGDEQQHQAAPLQHGRIGCGRRETEYRIHALAVGQQVRHLLPGERIAGRTRRRLVDGNEARELADEMVGNRGIDDRFPGQCRIRTAPLFVVERGDLCARPERADARTILDTS